MTREEKLKDMLEMEGSSPEWCGLLELMSEQIGNYMAKKWDYELAEKYHPDIFTFTFEDFMTSRRIEDIPEDWLAYAYACMDKMGI